MTESVYHDRPATVCDSDEAKQQLLAAAVADAGVRAAAEAMKPDDASDSWAPGVFEYAVAVRNHLPAGLDAGDFDGVNVAAAIEPSP